MVYKRQLAEHLSYKSALALLPPAAITPPIEAVRRTRDKSYARWPPHINLIYPFLASPSEGKELQMQSSSDQSRQLKEDIRSRIFKVVQDIPPFHISLSADPAGEFIHSKKSRTVWLRPLQEADGSDETAITQLQVALQAEFSQCIADDRPFVPHLSVGQAWNERTSTNLHKEIKDSISNFLSKIGPNPSKEGEIPACLDWYVDQVYVLERNGFHGRFQVIGSVKLGEP
ncbi:hypothetical protein GQ43DRAFT_441805 [Delitschia confertaspora ATCC 74209]|uniref:2'-5' RNA ligase n=1 Tax=Delitschia confertaspora ATCC 74209 TaxID=1513339 RepID=A0A9P4JPF5_9PLEO|nr:hypothetical protein GQ43DRAFT_441805 [Delitschia confertaspora ATCC 74209]